jgi:hypothetical protein
MCRAAHRSWDRYEPREERIRHVVDDSVRVSDDDRQRVVEALRTHTAEGRLTLDEFAERVGEAWAARTHGDLRSVLRELPVPAPPPPPAARERERYARPRSGGAPVWLLVAALVVVGSVLMSHFAWWLIPIGFCVFGKRAERRSRYALPGATTPAS